jgi:hypothetical protein
MACDAFPYVGGNTTLVVFMPPWALTQLSTAVTNPEMRAQCATTLNWVLPSLGMRWEDTQLLWVPTRELAHYEGQTIATSRATAVPIRPRRISISSASSAARRAS